MNSKYLNWILGLVIVILGMVIFLMLRKPTVDINVYTAKIEIANKNIDSLEQVIVELTKTNGSIVDDYENKIKIIDETYKSEISRIKIKYEKKGLKIIPLTDQVKLLAKNIGQIDSLPKMVLSGNDTSISINKRHVLIINETYLVNDKLNEMIQNEYVHNMQTDSILNQSKIVIERKNNQISVLQQLNVQYDTLVQSMQKEAILAKKTYQKQKLRTIITSGSVGIIIGVVTVFL